MRLIDADALKMHKYHSTTTYENAVAIAYVDNAPTIPAISVEWLEDKELDYRTTGDKMFSDAFAVVIGEWQKEQEAQK